MLAKKTIRRIKIRHGIRKQISGTAKRPRISVFRSNKEIYVQLIDDVEGHTLAQASSREKNIISAKGTKIDKSKLVGLSLAKKAVAAKIKNVVFDRGGYLYHGRVKALAEGTREGGLRF